MSFFTALADAYGAFGAGRQQRLQNQQEQTRLNQEQQFRTAEERRQDATLAIDQQRATRENNDYQANAGIDPATQRPFLTPPSVSQIVPNNKGRGGTPTPQQMIAHYDYVARWAAQTHQTNLYNWAKNQQAETLRQMDAAQTQAGEDHREELRIQAEAILQDRRSSDDDRRQANAFLHSDQLQQNQEAFTAGQNRLYRTPGGAGRAGAPDKAQAALSKWHTDFGKATTGTAHPKYPGVAGSPVVGKPPAVSSKDISDIRLRLQGLRAHGYKGPLDPFSAIDDDTDPITLSQQLANMTGNQTLKTLLLERGRVAAMQHSAAAAPAVGETDPDAPPDLGPPAPPPQ